MHSSIKSQCTSYKSEDNIEFLSLLVTFSQTEQILYLGVIWKVDIIRILPKQSCHR